MGLGHTPVLHSPYPLQLAGHLLEHCPQPQEGALLNRSGVRALARPRSSGVAHHHPHRGPRPSPTGRDRSGCPLLSCRAEGLLHLRLRSGRRGSARYSQPGAPRGLHQDVGTHIFQDGRGGRRREPSLGHRPGGVRAPDPQSAPTSCPLTRRLPKPGPHLGPRTLPGTGPPALDAALGTPPCVPPGPSRRRRPRARLRLGGRRRRRTDARLGAPRAPLPAGLPGASGSSRPLLCGAPATSGECFRRGAGHGARKTAAAHRRAGPARARPAGAAGATARLAALRPRLRDAVTAALGPPAAGAGLVRRAPREPTAAAARPPPALRPGPPRHAQVLAVAARRAVLLARHAGPARLLGAELGPREGLGNPDLQRTHGERGPGDRTGHVPRLAAGAQARGGGLHCLHAGARGRAAIGALSAAAPGHDSSKATKTGGPQHRGACAEPGEDAHGSLGLPCETGGEEKGQGHRGLKRGWQAACSGYKEQLGSACQGLAEAVLRAGCRGSALWPCCHIRPTSD